MSSHKYIYNSLHRYEDFVHFNGQLLQINVLTQRGFIPVDERMRVVDADGNLVSWNYSIVDVALNVVLTMLLPLGTSPLLHW